MKILSALLMLPLTGPLYGLRFIAQKIQEEMDAALMNEGRLEAELINLSLRHDLGQISGEEYEEEEAYLLEQLDAIRSYEEALLEDYQDAYDEAFSEDEGVDEAEWTPRPPPGAADNTGGREEA